MMAGHNQVKNVKETIWKKINKNNCITMRIYNLLMYIWKMLLKTSDWWQPSVLNLFLLSWFLSGTVLSPEAKCSRRAISQWIRGCIPALAAPLANGYEDAYLRARMHISKNCLIKMQSIKSSRMSENRYIFTEFPTVFLLLTKMAFMNWNKGVMTCSQTAS